MSDSYRDMYGISEKKMNRLDRNLFFRGFRKKLTEGVGTEQASSIWREANREYERILREFPEVKKHKGAMVLPAVALYRVLISHGCGAGSLLNDYGEMMGKRFAGIVHKVTSIPGADRLIWKNVNSIMNKMSGEDLGYQRRIASEPPEMYGVDILSCPYHELAKQLGTEEAVLCICHMDKEYSKGFRHIRYERYSALPEGAPCCEYRLRFDPDKQ